MFIVYNKPKKILYLEGLNVVMVYDIIRKIIYKFLLLPTKLKNKYALRRDVMEETENEILSNERKTEIENIASNIRKEYNLLTVDFDLIEFLNTIFSFEIQNRMIEDDTTGLLLVDDNNLIPESTSNRVIVINQKLINDDEFMQKRRFICAHELGHFILHKKDQSVFAKRETKIKKSLIEQEAEYFAYCLLMPRKAIEILYTSPTTKILQNIYNESIIDIVSNVFNVSKKKATQRLMDLGHIKNA